MKKCADFSSVLLVPTKTNLHADVKSGRRSGKSSLKSNEFDINDLTVSAEEFQNMLDSNQGINASGSLNTLSSKTASGKVGFHLLFLLTDNRLNHFYFSPVSHIITQFHSGFRRKTVGLGTQTSLSTLRKTETKGK